MTTLQALPLPSNFEDLCELFLLYIAYSTLGWCGEMLYCSIPKGHICEKRGFLNGFLCPIYGHGALLVLYLLHGGFQNPVLTFIFGAIVTSILEYFTSWIMEKLFHMRWWDYSHYKFQINGRVCLLNSTCFGLACVLLCHLVQPWLWEHIVNLGPTITVPLASFIFGIYLMYTFLFPGQYANVMGYAIVVSVSLFFSVILAKLVGGMLPLAAKKLGADPAIMATPFITTIVDACSLILYFQIAQLVFRNMM